MFIVITSHVVPSSLVSVTTKDQDATIKPLTPRFLHHLLFCVLAVFWATLRAGSPKDSFACVAIFEQVCNPLSSKSTVAVERKHGSVIDSCTGTTFVF